MYKVLRMTYMCYTYIVDICMVDIMELNTYNIYSLILETFSLGYLFKQANKVIKCVTGYLSRTSIL